MRSGSSSFVQVFERRGIAEEQAVRPVATAGKVVLLVPQSQPSLPLAGTLPQMGHAGALPLAPRVAPGSI
jgi:hypothetical protein